MIKTFYQKELAISDTQQRNGPQVRKDILKIQSWLVLYEMSHPGAGTLTSIDGEFGPATDQAVKNFQKLNRLPVNGVVDDRLFAHLSAPLKQAFETVPTGRNLRELVVNTAILHLENHPFELMINKETNSGPWVRSYMDGHEGDSWFWCMGFVQAIIDQATSTLGKTYKTLMPPTYSCDSVGSFALTQKNLVRSVKLRNNPALAKPGDIFLIQKSAFDWVHTGIIVKAGAETIESIEGNTNSMGSRNGNAVFRRVRNFMQSKIDIVSLDPIT
jgi:hypothetical protein